MDTIGRRGVLGFIFAAGVTAAAGTLIGPAQAAIGAAGDSALPGSGLPSDAASAEVTEIADVVESAVEPTQAVVIRPGRRRGRIIIRPRPRRPRTVCRRNWRGRLVCVRRF